MLPKGVRVPTTSPLTQNHKNHTNPNSFPIQHCRISFFPVSKEKQNIYKTFKLGLAYSLQSENKEKPVGSTSLHKHPHFIMFEMHVL